MIGSITRQQFSRRKIEPNSTALAPVVILLLIQQTRRPSRTDNPMRILPAMMRVSKLKVDRVLVIKSATTTPFASRIKKIPRVIIPKIQTTIKIQIMGPAQQRTKAKKMSESTIAAKAATSKAAYPS